MTLGGRFLNPQARKVAMSKFSDLNATPKNTVFVYGRGLAGGAGCRYLSSILSSCSPERLLFDWIQESIEGINNQIGNPQAMIDMWTCGELVS